jgi:Flp pilus assembly protein TadD
MKTRGGQRRLLAAVLTAAGTHLAPAWTHAEPAADAPAEGTLEPDFARGLKAIDAKDWNAAIRLLSSAALRDTRNADIQNSLAYAYRNSGSPGLAFRHYNRALELNPRHRGAHEYLGEAYLMIGNVSKAEEQLAELGKICLIPCEEAAHLAQKIAQWRQGR